MSFNIDSNDLLKKVGLTQPGEIKQAETEEPAEEEIIQIVDENAEEGNEAEKINDIEYEFEIAAEQYLNNMIEKRNQFFDS